MTESPETSTGMTIQQAMQAALEEQSADVDQAESGAADTEVAKDGDTEAGETEQPLQDTAEEGATDESSDQLLTEEEAEELSPADRKRLNKILTPKFQELAAKRKRYEEYEFLIDALENNPSETLKAMARAQGLDIVDKASEAKPSPDEGDELAELYKLFGDENRALADALVSAIDKRAEKLADKKLEQIQPQLRNMQAMELETKQKRVEEALNAFSKAHPDWKRHEARMVEIGQKFQPSQQMSAEEYMDSLYKLATIESQAGDQTARTIERIKRNAAASDATPASGVAPQKVNPIPDRPLTLREAYEHALKGQVRET